MGIESLHDTLPPNPVTLWAVPISTRNDNHVVKSPFTVSSSQEMQSLSPFLRPLQQFDTDIGH